MANQLKLDPTKTTTLRNSFYRDIKRRFRRLKIEVVDLIDTQDALGLKEDPLVVMDNSRRNIWRFKSSPEKQKAFREWLKEMVDAGILEVSKHRNRPWLAEYIESSFKKGLSKSYRDVNKKAPGKTEEWYIGAHDEFVRSSLWAPETTDKLELMFTRSFDKLKGITDEVSNQLSIILTSGLADGRGPKEIAREISKTIDTIAPKRALTIARTEIIYAHAEGQLQAFEKMGIEEVGVEAEWSTAKDDRVCPLCAPLEGMVIPVSKAHGLIPRHPNCRCAWVPALKNQKQEGQLWGKAGRQAVRESIAMEGGIKKTFEASRKKSLWAGKGLVKK